MVISKFDYVHYYFWKIIIKPVWLCFSPVKLCATLGTTGVCAFDKLSELGPVCMSPNLVCFYPNEELCSSTDMHCTHDTYVLKLIIFFKIQAQRRDCGSTLMRLTLAQPTSVPSSAGHWRGLNLLTLLCSTLPSGWWSILTAQLSGEWEQEHLGLTPLWQVKMAHWS